MDYEKKWNALKASIASSIKAMKEIHDIETRQSDLHNQSGYLSALENILVEMLEKEMNFPE